jgi:serine/threonine protein kinase/thioredoxin-like negative regulator of GroEL
LHDIDAIFSAAIEISSPEERAQFVQNAAAGDEALCQRAGELIDAYFRAGDFLESPPAAIPADAVSAVHEGPGTSIGRYKLLEQIGEGGFAVVFMAEQSDPVRRKVALKIIKAGMDTKQVVARFEAERQALALMDHPSIAKVFDAGATEAGRPYFVMELVRGVPITPYCDEQNLSIDDRLRLFAQVCQAVQHAHQKGVIHRDLKPSNILVNTQDDRPLAKVIDFGIAKATQTPLTDKTLFTDFRQLIGTPAYMSPEQAEGSLDIDTRSDVYSLGVLLYELLAGAPPFDPKELRSKSFAEMQRIIREVEPPTPSSRISTLIGTQTTVAVHRAVDARKLAATLRGDLDWIVMRCLEKDRGRRYATALALEADIQRYLSEQPVEAREPTRLYRLKKFIRRNTLAVISAVAVIAALTIGLILASVGLIQARRQTQIADTEAARSSHVAEFLDETLAAAGPAVARGRDATLLREILEKTSQRVEKRLKDQPEVQGDLWFTLGRTYGDIGDVQRAIALYQRAVDSYRSAFQGDHPKLARALGRLGALLSFNQNLAAGRASADFGLEMAQRCDDPEALAECLTYRGKASNSWAQGSAEAIPYYREAIALRTKLGTNPVALANDMQSLATCGDVSDEKRKLLRQALEIHRRELGADHPSVTTDEYILGQLDLDEGNFAEAERFLREMWNYSDKVIGSKDPDRLIVFRFLIEALTGQGKVDEAAHLIELEYGQRDKSGFLPFVVYDLKSRKPDEVDALLHRVLPPELSMAGDLMVCGDLDASRGDLKSAAERFARACQLNPDEVDARFDLAILLAVLGKEREYRSHCHDFLQWAAKKDEFRRADMAAKSSLLLPLDDDDRNCACRLADFVAAATVPADFLPWARFGKALAEYRRQRYQSAIDWADKSLSANAVVETRACDFFVQAAANAKLNHLPAARAALVAGERLVAQHRRRDDSFGVSWRDWLIADLLRKEAAQLVADVPQPPTTP